MNKRIITNASVSGIVIGVIYLVIGVILVLGTPLFGGIFLASGILSVFTSMFINKQFKSNISKLGEQKTPLLVMAILLIVLLNLATGIILLMGIYQQEDEVEQKAIEFELATQRATMILSKILIYGFLAVMAVVVLVPFYWMFNTALKSAAEINESITPTLYPKTFTLNNFITAFGKGGGIGNDGKSLTMINYLSNTFIIAIASTLLGTIFSIMMAFALARLNFKGREAIFTLLLATMMIPGEMMVLSNFRTVFSLGWYGRDSGYGSFYSMIVPFLVSIFHVYLLRQTFKQIPNELYYAAKVDGTSDWKYLWKIMVPMAKSSIITITILKIMGSWNAYVWPNLVAEERYKPITAWLRGGNFRDSEGLVLINEQMAATIMVTLPLILLFIFFRKYIMSGVSRSGIKG